MTRLGKLISTLVMARSASLAILLPQNIWQLKIKTELPAQTAPALLLGLHWKHQKSAPLVAGFLTGTGITLGFLIGHFLFPQAGRPPPLWQSRQCPWARGQHRPDLALQRAGGESSEASVRHANRAGRDAPR
ncbi:MAG: hypothetical protein LJE91_01860 [Gammaproteobacteria bacterium]|nr:hypothetical protein [Gammaproteobacteria bacterium]